MRATCEDFQRFKKKKQSNKFIQTEVQNLRK